MKENAPNILSKVIFKSPLRKFYFLFLILAVSFAATAQNTFNVVSGNWNTAGNWSLNHVPNGTENLVIPAGSICNLDVNYTGGNTFSITIGGTLNIPSGITLDRTAATIILNANGATISGGGNINIYTLNIATPNTTDVVNFLNSSAANPITIGKGNASGIINFTKGLLKLSGQTLGIAKTATLNGNGGNFANGADGAGSVNADGGTLLLLGSSGGTTTVNGQVTFNNIDFGTDGNVILDLKTATSVINGVAKVVNQQGKLGNTNSPIWGASSTLNITYNSGFNYTPGKEWVSMASGTIGVTPGYPNNVILSNTGNSAGGFNNGNGWVPSGAWAINGVFTLGNNSTNAQIDFSNVTSFTCGGFVLNSNSRFTAPKTTMTVKGDWADNQAVSGTGKGFFINGTSTVVFSGAGTCSTPNTIAGPGANTEIFNNLTIASNVNLLSPVSLNSTGIFTLTSGILTTTSGNSLTVTNTATNAITGGSASSYINGPVKWNLAATANTYVFPVGSGTCTADYLRFTLNKADGTATTATVQAFAPGSGGTVDATLSSISATEYWSLTTSSVLSAGSTVSVVRPTAITPLAYIAKSNSAAGVYTSLGGTTGTFGVTNSNDIGTNSPYFFALGTPPIVSTLTPTSITTTGATLQGAFNTQGASHNTSFTYGTTTSTGLGTPSTVHSPINSSSSVLDSAVITGLTANTLYTFKATDGVNSGSDVTFITSPNPPTIGAASSTTGSGFTANWTAPAITGTAPYTYTIQVSSDPSFATGVTTQTGVSSSSTSFPVTGLTSATVYYYRVETVNASGPSVWSAISAGVATDIVPTAPCTTGTGSTTSTGSIARSFDLPTIDGQAETIWDGIPANDISFLSVGSSTGNTKTWKSIWTPDSLYFLVHVNDATLISQKLTLPGSVAVPGATPSNSNNYYESDGVELTLDADYSHGGSYDGYNDVQFRFNLGATTVSGQSSGTATQFTGTVFNRVAPRINFKIIPVTGGYNVEAAIPWGTDGAHPGIDSLPGTYGTRGIGKDIGLEIQVNDATNTSNRTAQYSWFNGSQDPYQNPGTFAKATLRSCPNPPTVILPTVTNIGATTATLGATVTSSGDGALIARGTGFTADPVTTGTSNAMAEGGTGITIYSGPQRTGLAPQTKYYYLGYANNVNNETGVSTVASFYTLSALPTVQPTLTSTNCSAITLNWSAISFPPTSQATQTGYLILRRQDGTDPTATGIAIRVATKQSDLPAGTTLLTTINSGATLTYADATAVTGTTYNYLLVPFTWDGTATDSTYNYFTEGAAHTSASISAPVTPTFAPVAPICASGSLDPLPTTSTNNITGTWSPALDNTGTKTYTFTPTPGQCATITTLTITVNPGVTPTFTPIAPICSGSTLSPLPTTSTNNITGTWSPALDNTATKTYTFTPTTGQCASTTTLTITVNDPVTPTFAAIAPICAGSTLSALPTTSTNNITGTWSPALDNTGTKTYTFTPATGQCATTTTLSITVNPAVVPTFNQVAAICNGGTLNALPTTSTNNITGTWSPALNNTATTTYTFTPNSGQCATTTTLSITVNPVPTINAAVDHTPVNPGATVTLTGTSSVEGTYTWSASPETIIQSSGLSATSNPTQNTVYTLTVNYGAGCVASDNVSVAVITGDCVNAPNVFTPNGDGFHDRWEIYTSRCFEVLRVDVYNRWGGLVFHSDNYDNTWNGTRNGKPIPDGTYYYILKTTYADGRVQPGSGNVTIMR